MHRRLWSSLGLLASLSACATAQPQGDRVAGADRALYAGDPSAPPAFAALPDIESRQQSSRIIEGLSLARHVLATKLPTPPDDRRYQSLQSWIDQTVAPWIRARRDSVDEARFQFGIDAGAAADETVIGRGVLGLLEENTALELSQIPSPTELDTEPEIAEIFRELVTTQAKPFRNAAVSEYRLCSELGQAKGGELSRWAEFCRSRFERLRQGDTSGARGGGAMP